MSVLESLSSSLGQRDHGPNHELAKKLSRSPDAGSIRELADAAGQGPARVASDCLEVLEELGRIDPALIVPHVDRFVSLLSSANNRLVWGAMAALSTIASRSAATLERKLPVILKAMETGSVITVDNAVSVLAEVARARTSARAGIERALLAHLGSCRSKEVPQHAERAFPAVTTSNVSRFARVLEKRLGELTVAQARRVRKVLGQMAELDAGAG